ncbi:MAG: zinc-ribbon domain-containing protein [Eubacterium sp.]|nr:zinc-ribbon domain-containing protein [Eubacterium sp.]
MFCWKCGKENSDEMNYCKHCGAKLNLGKQTNSEGEAAVTEGSGKSVIIISAAISFVIIIGVVIVLFVTGVFNKSENNGDTTVSDGTPQSSESGGMSSDPVEPQMPEPTPTAEPAMEPTPTPVPTLSPNEVKYRKANDLFKKKRYEKARVIYRSLKNYKNSKKRKEQCDIKIFVSQKIHINNWHDVHTDVMGDGYYIGISWGKIKGASGYELYTKTVQHEKTYQHVKNQESNYYETQDDYFFTISEHIKVRAYMKTKHGKKYTSWSEMRTWHNPFE